MEDALSTLIKTIGDGVLEYVQKGIAEMELPIPEPDNTTFDLEEAARYVGVHKETIRRCRDRGEFPSFKAGNKILIHKRELDEWMTRGGSP